MVLRYFSISHILIWMCRKGSSNRIKPYSIHEHLTQLKLLLQNLQILYILSGTSSWCDNNHRTHNYTQTIMVGLIKQKSWNGMKDNCGSWDDPNPFTVITNQGWRLTRRLEQSLTRKAWKEHDIHWHYK